MMENHGPKSIVAIANSYHSPIPMIVIATTPDYVQGESLVSTITRKVWCKMAAILSDTTWLHY